MNTIVLVGNMDIDVLFDNVPDSSVRVLVETLMLIYVGSMMFIPIGKSLGARFLGAALRSLGVGAVRPRSYRARTSRRGSRCYTCALHGSATQFGHLVEAPLLC